MGVIPWKFESSPGHHQSKKSRKMLFTKSCIRKKIVSLLGIPPFLMKTSLIFKAKLMVSAFLFAILFALFLTSHTPVSISVAKATEAIPTCADKTATIYVSYGTIVGGPMDGLPYDGILIGTDGDDVIVGTDGDDYIHGGPGDDTICGEDGDHHLRCHPHLHHK